GAVVPRRGPDGAGPVEQRGAVLAEVPVAPGPAHRRRVEGGKQGDPGRRRANRRDVIGQEVAQAVVEVDFDRVDVGQRPRRHRTRPPRPPPDARAGAPTAPPPPPAPQPGASLPARHTPDPAPHERPRPPPPPPPPA